MLGGTEGTGWRGWGQWARGHLGGDGTKRGWGCREGLGAAASSCPGPCTRCRGFHFTPKASLVSNACAELPGGVL